tara:strand:- start:127 stop:789 length:663 start_codon:yes stop_codon:yes gene_type:complete
MTKIRDFIDGLRDEGSEIIQDANELFLSLDQSYDESRRECIVVCTQFMMDLLTHILHTHYDPMWLFMNEDNESLQKRLAKSKETEKQQLLTKVDSKSQEDRYIMMERQKLGLSNFFKELGEEKIQVVQSKEYAESNEQERRDMLEDINSSIRLMVDIMNEDLNPNGQNLDFEIPEVNLPPSLQDEDADNGYIDPHEIIDENNEDYMGGMMEEDFGPEFNE